VAIGIATISGFARGPLIASSAVQLSQLLRLFFPLLLLSACGNIWADPQQQITGPDHRNVFVIADAGCTAQFTADPDDCMAIEAMFRNPEVRVIGIMASYGNKDIHTSNRLIRKLFSTTHHYSGSAGKTGTSTSDHEEVAALLEDHKNVDLIVLSPATDAKHLLVEYPKVLEHLNSVVFVAGRAPGVKFQPGGRKVVKDFNYFQDPTAFHELLPVLNEHQIPTYFSGYTAGMNVKLPEGYLRSDFIARQQRAWHRKTEFWFGRNLPSFDTVASLVVTSHMRRMACYPVRPKMTSTKLILERRPFSVFMFCEGH